MLKMIRIVVEGIGCSCLSNFFFQVVSGVILLFRVYM